MHLSITFTCTQDNNTNQTYPRTTDPASGASLPVVAKDSTTVSVNVGASAQTDQYAHTFVTASSNAVSSGGGFTHTFISAEPNAVYNGGGTEAHIMILIIIVELTKVLVIVQTSGTFIH